jgi:hypothetical protein
VHDDRHGVWLFAPVGSAWVAPHDHGSLPVDVLVLITPGRWYATWWIDDPHDRRIEIDVCLPPERTADAWSYVDLELDVVRHEPDFIEVHDRDEFDTACRNAWITPSDARFAEATATTMRRVLERRTDPWGDEGWRRLADAKARREHSGVRTAR